MERLDLGLSLLLGISLCALAACKDGGGGGRDTDAGDPEPAVSDSSSVYTLRNLVSNGAVPAEHTDANLKNPWGIVFNPDGPVWVANNGSHNSTLYDGTGAPYPASGAHVFSIPDGSRGPAYPTGIVYNASSDFAAPVGPLPTPSMFIFSGEGGTIAAWGLPNLNSAVTVYDDGDGGAVYTGLALASNGTANFLYAADFHNDKIDVFNGRYEKVTAPGGFVDPGLPAGYGPYNIQAIGDALYVAYARHGAGDDELPGAGLGLIDRFDADGHFVKRVVSHGALNAPWGLAQAPADFGSVSNALLVGNFGDGRIHAYDIDSGAPLGRLRTAAGPIVLPGLWGIAFGTGNNGQPKNTLFFAAGINGEADGIYGRIDLATP